MVFLVNIILGFLAAQLIEISTRDKQSEKSPTRFNIKFFLKDNYLKIITSLLISLTFGFFIHYNQIEITKLGEFIDLELPQYVYYFLIGFAPEIVLQILKNKMGLLQPKEITIGEKGGEIIKYTRR